MCSVGDASNLGQIIKGDGQGAINSNHKEKLMKKKIMRNICIIYKVMKITEL